ncbi:ABC transporter substrate-binding protein [Sellimonas sp.]|uniref:ABC transporter substrate-binding protein n=1 Tax=Sellimonas sp. TaxID=2021466 RepID=UPI000B383046|nr:extracellular solute-binding protein [Sellimonas sp.]OUP00320.1 ABC transporter substrate-binding protein [Drancourtella sp. An210]OUP66709.1 ABC transporter substrate-binding protein [Drancourtella sp. An177]
MKKKRVLALLLASVMTLGLAACGSSDDSKKESKKDDNKLTIWAWDEAFNIKAANVAADMYKEDHSDAEIEVVTMAQDDIVAKLNTSLSSQSYDGLPDIVLIEDYRIQGYLNAYEDEFADLSDIAKPEDFAAYKTGVNQKDGKMYGIPFDSGVAAVFYRTDYIEQAGYTKEDMQNLTWDKYIEIGKAVKEKTGKAMLTLDPSDIGQIRMMMQSAGTWYTDEDGKVNIAGNQGLKDAINTYKKLVDAGITETVSDWDQFVGAFNSGDVATVPTGCWISPSVLGAEDQSGKWAIAPFPKMAENADSVNASSIGGGGWYVLKNVGNEDLAKDFLKETFASNVDLMNQLATDINLVSTLKAASSAENYSKGVEFYGGQEIFKDFAAWTNEVPTVNYGENTYEIEDLMTEVVQAILGGADIDKTLEEYQTQIESVVAN